MSDTSHPATLDTAHRDVRCERFENAWRCWRPGQELPRWQQFLPAPSEPCSPELIFVLLHIDIEFRAKAGSPALLAERYFDHPRLQQEDAHLDAEQQGKLIHWEYQQRWQNGQRARRADYEAAFPQHAAALSDLKPACRCPQCGKECVLEETSQTAFCMECGGDSPLTGDSPPFVATTARAAATLTRIDLRDYELIEQLGAGGMGEVYRSCDPALERDLAIKVMKASLRGHREGERRFLREARVTGSLQHPGIVTVHNLGRLADGRLHYTMRLVRGRTFAAILKEEAGQPESLPSLLGIFEKICQAVAYAHSKRVIHRDLKPHNVMVGRFGEVQVMDWGLAKLLTEDENTASPGSPNDGGTVIRTESADTPLNATQLGATLGTPAYMSPEQAAGDWKIVDERSDVFALGSILCEMLTGQPAYTGPDREEVLRRARRGDLAEALSRLEHCGADAALLALCRDCLTPAQEGRPRDAGVVAERMAAYQTEVGERLRQAQLAQAQAEVKAREERKRRRWAIAFVLLLLVAATFSIWLALRATHAEQKARKSEGVAQDRLGQIEKANDILASIFHDLDPRAEERGGPSLRLQMSQHMEKAAAQLDEVAIGDPLTTARLQFTLGKSLNALVRTRQAIELLSKAYQTQADKLGPDHSDTLKSMMELALAYHADGQLDKSVALLEQCLEKRRTLLVPSDPELRRTIHALAGVYLAGHEFEKIEPLVQELKSQEADDVLDGLAFAYFIAGQEDRAVPLLERLLEIRKAKDGPEDTKTLHIMSRLAVCYRRTGQVNRAIPLYEQILPKQQAMLSEDHRDTLMTMYNLGRAYCTVGRLKDGVALMQRSWDRWKVNMSPDMLDTLSMRISLSMTYQKLGEFGRADTLLREGVNRQRTKGGPESASTLRLRALLGLNLLRQQKFEEAEGVLSECVKLCEKRQPDNWETYNVRSLLGEALLGQKKYANAESLLVQGYGGMRQREANIPPESKVRLTEALERLVRLYEATNQTEKAADWRNKLDETKAASK
jgi:serine/threonine protein kinase